MSQSLDFEEISHHKGEFDLQSFVHCTVIIVSEFSFPCVP